MPTSTPFLSGLKVLELGDGVAGATATATLALLGADVTKVVGGSRGRTMLAAVLDRSKRLVTVDEAGGEDLGALVADAAIVIDDRTDGLDDADGRAGPAVTSSSVWVTISPYGLDGPSADRPGGELVAQAAGGLLSTIEPVGGGRPTSPPGYVALRAVGHVAALAALHGLDRVRGDGRPVHVDVSAQEAVVFTSALPECAHLLFRCPGRAGSGRYVAPSGLFPCVDGLVRIAAIEDHQWKGMVACLGAPEWTAGLETRAARAEHAEMITEQVAAWSATQEKAVCADLLQRNGVPSTPVNGPVELLETAQFLARDFLVRDEADGVSFVAPGAPWVVTSPSAPERPPASGDAAGRLEGLQVTEFTHVLAGPIVGALLGAMGADVVRFEDEERLDIYRRTGPFADGVAGPERGAYFAVANFAKHSVAVGGEGVGPAVATLLRRADVVIENVGLSRLQRLGVDVDATVGEQGAPVVHVSGFGVRGPLAEYRVYANNVQAFGGLAHLTRDEAGEPARLGTVLADPLSSVVAATVVAAWALGPARSRGAEVDLSMAEVVATLVGEFVAAASVGGTEVAAPPGNELAPYAPHAVFEGSDGRFVAIAVETDAEWRALLDVLDADDLDRPEWASVGGRWNDRREIECRLAEVVAKREVDAIVAALAAGGVRSAPVLRAADLLDDAHLRARGFFPEIDHPDPDLGRTRIVGMPWRFAGGGALRQAPPPRLGDANDRWLPVAGNQEEGIAG